jgi:hypothetical protein
MADGHLNRYRSATAHPRWIFRDTLGRSVTLRRVAHAVFDRGQATRLYLLRRPQKRLHSILGHYSLEVTQLYVLEDEAKINGSHSPFDLLNGLE